MVPNWKNIASGGDLTEAELQADALDLAWDEAAGRREKAGRKFEAALRELGDLVRRHIEGEE